MEFAKYQIQAMRTKGNFEHQKEQMTCAAMGIAGEAGEVADYIKKINWHGHEFNRKKIVEELGDVLWNIALAADAIGVGLAEIAEVNIEKNRERYPSGFDPERSRNRRENL